MDCVLWHFVLPGPSVLLYLGVVLRFISHRRQMKYDSVTQMCIALHVCEESDWHLGTPLVFIWIRVAQPLMSYVVFCRSFLYVCPFPFGLCIVYCLTFFDLRLLMTTLISSNCFLNSVNIKSLPDISIPVDVPLGFCWNRQNQSIISLLCLWIKVQLCYYCILIVKWI